MLIDVGKAMSWLPAIQIDGFNPIHKDGDDLGMMDPVAFTNTLGWGMGHYSGLLEFLCAVDMEKDSY